MSERNNLNVRLEMENYLNAVAGPTEVFRKFSKKPTSP